MEAIVLLIAAALAATLALVRSFDFIPGKLSDFELERRAEGGDSQASYELSRRPLLPALTSLQTLKSIVLVVALAALLIVMHQWWIGLLLTLGFLLAAELAVTKGWLRPAAKAIHRAVEPAALQAARAGHGVLRHLAPRIVAPHEPVVGSRQELLRLIAHNQHMLGEAEKARIQGALAFGELKIADVMVPRDKIVTVDIGETVGPVLLDRLHKVGHNIFVVVKKDIDHIKGLAYMADLTSGHPDLKTIKDAVRPTVHYLAQGDPLDGVLAASLQSGRQLFIVVGNQGNTVGLITLRDVLAKLMGTAPPAQTSLSTDPKKVKS